MNNPNNGPEEKNNKIKKEKAGKTAVWPLIAGVVIIGFSIVLLTLRVVIPSFILVLTGFFLIIYWIYITKNRRLRFKEGNGLVCICAICQHDQSRICIRQKCLCCTIAKGERIVGHSNNPLQ